VPGALQQSSAVALPSSLSRPKAGTVIKRRKFLFMRVFVMIAMHRSDLLEPGMAIAYSIIDGKVERLILVGIIAQAPTGQSVFDTIKNLQLQKGNETSDGIAGRNPIRLTGKDVRCRSGSERQS
jgi:hypothetical protein